MTLRSETAQKAYEDKLAYLPDGCIMCRLISDKENIIFEADYWFVIKNNYPYDNIASKHNMLVLRRHESSLVNLSDLELYELDEYIKMFEPYYDSLLYNMRHGQSCKTHIHLHLLKYK